MRSKINVNIDSELLELVTSCCDSDLDSIIQDALAQFLGIRQIWVKSDTLESLSISENKSEDNKPQNIYDNKHDNAVPIEIFTNPGKKKNESRFRRKPKYVLKIWDNIEKYVDKVFTPEEYFEAALKGGINYKESAKKATILEHLNILEEAHKIIILSFNPRTYRKIDTEKDNIQEIEDDDSEPGKDKDNKQEIEDEDNKSDKSDNKSDKSDDDKEPEEKIGEIIDHGKDVQSRERRVEREIFA